MTPPLLSSTGAPPVVRGLPVGARIAWRMPLLGTLAVLLPALFAYLWAHDYTGPHHGQFDLKIYYRAVSFWAAGNNLYDYAQYDPINISLGFTYPPLAAALMRPMTLVGMSAAIGISVLAILGSAVGCVWLSLRERFAVRGLRMAVLAGAVTGCMFTLEPVRQTLAYGQINLYLGLLVLGDLLVLARRDSRWAGVGVGLALAVKLTPGVFLLLFVLARQWRAVVVALGTAVGATLATAVVAPAETWQYFTSLLWDTTRVGTVGSAGNESINGLIHRLVQPAQPGGTALLLAVLLVGTLAVKRIRAALAAGDMLAAVTLTGLLGALISPVTWTHHIVWVIPAAVALAARLVRALQAAALAPSRSMGDVRARAGALAPTLGLVLLGVPALGLDPREAFSLPFADYTQAPLLQVLAASLPMFWGLATLAFLPVGEPVVRAADDPALSRRLAYRSALATR